MSDNFFSIAIALSKTFVVSTDNDGLFISAIQNLNEIKTFNAVFCYSSAIKL